MVHVITRAAMRSIEESEGCPVGFVEPTSRTSSPGAPLSPNRSLLDTYRKQTYLFIVERAVSGDVCRARGLHHLNPSSPRVVLMRPGRVVMGLLFFPRGGSAYVVRYRTPALVRADCRFR